MDDKPRFWDFYRASLKLKDGEHKYLSNKESDLLSYLRLFLVIVFVVLLILLVKDEELRGNIFIDLFLAELVSLFLINLISISVFYSFCKFKKIPKNENDETEHPKRNPGRKILPFVYLIVTILLFINSVSFAYLMYFAEGWTVGNPVAVQAVIKIPDGKDLTLKGSGDSLKIEKMNKDIKIKVTTLRTPEQVNIYLNGEEVNSGDINYEDWYFWDSDYFKKVIHITVDEEKLRESNTLEIKGGNFDKAFTFTLERG